MDYEDCIFFRDVERFGNGRSAYDCGCRALRKRYCMRGKCKFYKSTAEWEWDEEGFVQRKET